ncbi:hypothetical protein ACVWXN_003124 [Bradyrhizobium sp. i1.4.4]
MTSSVAASPSGSSPCASARAFSRCAPPVMKEISSNSVSGAGDSETSSISTSRSVLPLTLVVWEAPSSAMI